MNLPPSHPLDPYRSPEDRDAVFTAATNRAGGVVVEYGRSVEGRPLVVARFDGPSADAPAVLLSANIHGPEWISSALALRLVQRLSVQGRSVQGHSVQELGPPSQSGGDSVDGELQGLRARATIFVAPCLNPDGYAKTWDEQGEGTVALLRTNANGVDLNRNFPIPPGHIRSRLPGQGSTKKGAATFIGDGPLSEPETAHLAAFLDDTPLVASANAHSFMGTTIPPRVTSRSAYRTYQHLSRAFARGQRRDRYWRLQSRFFDGFTGEMEDHQHHVHRTWAMTVECFPFGQSLRQHLFAPNPFWRFNPRDVERWTQNDLPGVVSFFHAALDLGPVVDP